MKNVCCSLKHFPWNFPTSAYSSYELRKPTYYEILGVSKEATTKEIKDAFLQKCKELHPDGKDFMKTKLRMSVTEDFMELKMAYNVLRHQQERLNYDRQLELRKDRYNIQEISGNAEEVLKQFVHPSFDMPNVAAANCYGSHFRDFNAELRKSEAQKKFFLFIFCIGGVFVLWDIWLIKKKCSQVARKTLFGTEEGEKVNISSNKDING